MTGGGPIPRPGEISLAHHGVLFPGRSLGILSDQFLDGLRQPMENGTVTLTRVHASVTYPAHFMLVAAMNPCPCGYLGDLAKECLCTHHQIRRYRARLSGPMMDRLDVQLHVPAVPVQDLTGGAEAEHSENDSKNASQSLASGKTDRYQQERVFSNAQLRPRHLKKYCQIDAEGQKPGRNELSPNSA